MNPEPAPLGRDRVSIGAAEHRARQAALRAAAERRGWSAVAVFGRGGGTYDRHGNVRYLSGHYESYPHLHDRAPLWTGRALSLLVVEVDGPTTLLCAAPGHEDDLAVDEVRVAGGAFAEQAGQTLSRLELAALAGLDAVPGPLARALPVDGFATADDVLEALRRVKSPAEQQVLRAAGRLGTRAVQAIIDAALPNATEGEAVASAAALAYGAGAPIYLLELAVGDRSESYAGRPLPGWRAERRLRRGELARLDLVLVLEGYYCDFGRSWVIGGSDAAPRYHELLTALRQSLDAAVDAARDGALASAVAQAGAAALPPGTRAGYPPHWGHGLGLGWEGPWLLPDSYEPLREATALAVETTLTSDVGTVAAEQNILVGPGGPELLTPARWEAAA